MSSIVSNSVLGRPTLNLMTEEVKVSIIEEEPMNLNENDENPLDYE